MEVVYLSNQTPTAQISFSPYQKPHKMTKTYRVLLSLIICISGFTLSHAQDNRIPAPVSVTIRSLQSIQQLPQPEWMIKEGSNPLSIEDILNGDIKDGQVVKIHQNKNTIEHYEKYWFAIEFISEVTLHNWLLHVENTYSGFGFSNNFSEIRSYGVQNGKLTNTGITGFFVPASLRDYDSRHTQSLLNLSLSSENSLTLWVHINKNYTITSSFPNLTIYDPNITLPTYTYEKRDFMIFGIFLIVWILSLIMYIYLKDETSFWFFVLMTTLIVQNLTTWSSDPLTSVLYPENPKYGYYIGILPSFFNQIFLLQFSRTFVNLQFKNKKLDKMMIWAMIVLFFVDLILFYSSIYFENNNLIGVFFIIYGLIYIASGTTYITLKTPLSKFIGGAILLFIIPQLIPLPFDNKYFTYSALILTITSGVGYRVKLLFQDRLQAEKEKKDLVIQQNTLLEKQVADRTVELTNSLQELKSTQAQLIQSEKLASLGELTAGIAHEIQNPLNFVNNFSEMSVELIEELKSPLTPDGGIREGEKLDMDLFEDVVQNLEKINLHGKRASSIVKGMLEHSRANTGAKELTDINALADEYLRLAYHGLRAKDSSFNSDFKTDFDENLPKIEVIPQDIGRVLLNIINNAFYAVSQRQTLAGLEAPASVKVSTQKSDNQIIIKIKDNGIGMNEAIKAKIFQPFFTTKPTGQGTGLGLSLAYDIITKGHGGTIEIHSTEGVGSEFIITLPILND
jgi:signal transduction histidine kinase